jgi:hypothetical protein
LFQSIKRFGKLKPSNFAVWLLELSLEMTLGKSKRGIGRLQKLKESEGDRTRSTSDGTLGKGAVGLYNQGCQPGFRLSFFQ